jgi:hypothetical protein
MTAQREAWRLRTVNRDSCPPISRTSLILGFFGRLRDIQRAQVRMLRNVQGKMLMKELVLRITRLYIHPL